KAQQPITRYIFSNCGGKVFDFAGLTNLGQLAYLLQRSRLLITCDTGTLQLASYFDKPIVAIFGPSNEKRYGPWSARFRVVKRSLFCMPCKAPQCRFGTVECMKMIKTEDVLRQARFFLEGKAVLNSQADIRDFKRVLVARTDRIGDVLLSTPVIKALRDSLPNAYIAMMVGPYAKEIVEGNPYLDEVIIYDKDSSHKSWASSLKFALNLRKKKFDLAVVLHPVNRVHLVCFLAGIPRRIGYDRKMGFLLTDRIKHTKQLGQKHESEYNLELLKYLGVEALDKTMYMPIKAASEKWLEELFGAEKISPQDKIMAIHPGASCISKIWPAERFAQVADRAIEKYGFKVLIVAGPKDRKTAETVAGLMRHDALNLAGKTSVSQLASVLKRCSLFISNDSGPVHIASSVGTPVISIFGRSQKGLSPKRWGPQGKMDRILHKPEAGCLECLAHNCVKQFACLRAISVEDVLRAMADILGG
ncbi:MAG: lipopolysaccharide heptosyltransferase II, partial [Candidatus Omnitrophica bacterium]|nr:lipopolysaccharide heptosyltransferase II [Candidatus Omnitrophota bacterium]